MLVSVHQLPRAGFFAAALVNGIAQKQQYRLALGKFHGLVDRVPESFLLFLEDETDFLRDLADLLLISLHFHRKLIIVGVADGLEEKVLIPCLLFSVENQADLFQFLDLIQFLKQYENARLHQAVPVHYGEEFFFHAAGCRIQSCPETRNRDHCPVHQGPRPEGQAVAGHPQRPAQIIN